MIIAFTCAYSSFGPRKQIILDRLKKACYPGDNNWDYYSGAPPFKSSHCNSFEDRETVDFIYRPTSELITMTS